MKFFTDQLKVNDPEKSEGDKFSLSRFSLFICTLTAIGLVIIPFFTEIDLSTYDVMTNVIILLIYLFAGYSFGGKVMSSASKAKKEIEKIKKDMKG